MIYSEMTNSELNIEKLKLENEYESVKQQILKLTSRLEELDGQYNELISIQNKRKGF